MSGTLRFAEMFAGAGGLSMGLERAGWHCAWHAEIADAPRAILKHRWPDTPLYGDVTTLDGRALVAQHGPIDLLTGGSPCQDLSVAGKRAGLEGARSGLFYEQMRLWDETGADLCLWENVDGARSSNTGKDFGAVLRAFVGAAVPVPSDGWRSAGVAAGPTGVAAWRVLDAQFFGVPQRRRRVFVLGTRSGRIDPAEVLSLAESVRGDSPSSREAREGTAADAGGGSALAFNGYQRTLSGVASPLMADDFKKIEIEVLAFDWQNSPSMGMECRNESDDSLRTNAVPAVVAFDTTQVTSQTNRSNPRAGDPCHPLAAGGHAPLIVPIQEVGKRTGTSTTDRRASIGIGAAGDPMYTLQAGAQHGVVDCSLGDGPSGVCISEGVSHSLRAGRTQAVCLIGEVTHAPTHEGHDASEDGTGRGTPIICASDSVSPSLRAQAQSSHRTDSELFVVANTITAREAKGWNPAKDVGNGTISHGIPRRLMPVECERLMAWPDGHTLVPDAKGKPMSDAARYKAIGNGVASVHSHWIGWRLKQALAR